MYHSKICLYIKNTTDKIYYGAYKILCELTTTEIKSNISKTS